MEVKANERKQTNKQKEQHQHEPRGQRREAAHY